MALDVLNVGYGNLVPASRVVIIMQPGSAPLKRLRDRAAADGVLIDATQGRRTRSVVLVDSGHVILSAVQTQTLALRLSGGAQEPEGRTEAPR